MVNLTFGEQVKIILSRRGMTIKELAELIEERTGKKMSRQNLTQRLGRDNFQEQDMREIAEILGCPFRLSILDESEVVAAQPKVAKKTAEPVKKPTVIEAVEVEPVVEEPKEDSTAREVTIGDLIELEPTAVQEPVPVSVPEPKEEEVPKTPVKNVFKGFKRVSHSNTASSAGTHGRGRVEEQTVGEINPYTRREYATNSVRMHPKRIGYVQVYDQAEHKWTDMTEWAFLGYQERKKKLLGKDYVPPTYLD